VYKNIKQERRIVNMNSAIRIIFVLIAGVAFMMTSGCAGKEVKYTYSGFLTDYPRFKAGVEGRVNFVYFKEGVDFSKYNKVMMDHVVFYFKKDSKYEGIHPDVLSELAEAFHESVFEALQGAYPVVDSPGPDVMRIRVAITDVVPSKPGVNLVTTAMPGGFAVKAIKKAATGSHSFVGNTAMEAEILDSLTNERIAAAIDSRGKGDKFRVTEGLSKWGDVKDVFKFWAKRLKLWLDETHGIAVEK
jgi:hypothetical protein